MVVQQSVGRHDTESSRTADCVDIFVSDELMNSTVHLLLFCFDACVAVVVLSIFAFALYSYDDDKYHVMTDISFCCY